MLNESMAAGIKKNFIGLPITEASMTAEQSGLEVCVVRPGMPVQLTNDVKPNRVTFVVNEQQTVVGFRVG